WPAVQKVISGVVDKLGDKYVTLAKINGRELFVTIGPVKQEGKLVGAVLVGSYVQDLLRVLAQSTFADVTLYDLNGKLISTTFGEDETTKKALALDALQARKLLTEASESSLRRSVFLERREYDLIFGVFRARGEPLGFYSVALQRTYIASYGSTARNYMVLIFATALALVFGIGYFMANAITGRLQHLMENALAVASGDFTRRTHIFSDDEIGSLASSLDHMTESLSSYTNALQKRIEELTALYDGSTAVTVKLGLNLEQVLQAVTTSVKEVIRGTEQVIVYLLDENDRLLLPRAATYDNPDQFPSLAYDEKGSLQMMLAAAKPHTIRLADIGAHSINGTFKKDGASPALIAPLIAGQEIVGMLTLTPGEDDSQNEFLDEDNERLLGTMANQAAIAIKNAQLFEATQRAYEELPCACGRWLTQC
ncbi:MAG: GAF domain-containing protein, partial [Chloroflexi bacterium]|nr:GAF domain-containing protein [Chloroflexota bacterium]